MDTIIIPAPKTTAELRTRVAEHIAAIDAMMNGYSWNSNEAERHADGVADYLTEATDSLESAIGCEDAYNDARDNEAERLHPWLESERYP